MENCGDSSAGNPEEDDDAYADLEQWYATSLPHLHSSASFAHMADAFSSSQQIPPPTHADDDANSTTNFWATVQEQPPPELLLDVEQFVDDYAIELDSAGSAASPVSTLDDRPASWISSPDSTAQSHPADFNPAQTDAADDSFLTFVPKKLRAGSGVTPDAPAPRCCDVCHSDLHAKLLVRCAVCAFRRHLFCFSPPLRQHPALSALSHVARHKRRPITQLLAQWRCARCAQQLGAVQVAQSTRAPRVVQPVKPPPPHKANSSIQTVIPHASAGTPLAFDWYAFRAAKLAKVEQCERRDEEDDSANTNDDHANEAVVRDELAFYSVADALMRKTARFWQQHVSNRKQQRARAAARLLKCQFPAKRPLLVALSPRETAEALASNQKRQQQEDAEQRALFDDAQQYPLNDARPVFETLRWRPPPVVDAAQEDDGVAPEERKRVREREHACAIDRERLAREAQLMAAEDADAPTPAQAVRMARRRAVTVAVAIANEPSLLGLYLAARIIERVCVQWLRAAKTSIHTRQQAAIDRERERQADEHARMALEEHYQRHRRAHTQLLLGRLVALTQFTLTMVRRARRRLELARGLSTLLNDGVKQEDSQAGDNDEPTALRRLKLAQQSIQQFFLRRVRRYLQLRKRVMATRVVRWWKRHHYAHKFRHAALDVRVCRRDRAARRIQRSYYQFRAYKRFRAAREKHLLRRVARSLRGWLLQRVVRKERDRMVAFQAALVVGVRDLALDSTLDAILVAVGLALYEQSDFWNGAAVLERLRPRQRGPMERHVRFALAYCHHMSWYASCDVFQLQRAEQLYREMLSDASSRQVDAFVLHEFALVLMQREDFRGSLAMLARLIELFRDDDAFPLWLLLAGVQLQQVGRYDESAAYLTYLVDMALPAPFQERDVLALCAMSYEKAGSEGAGPAREAWRAAIRLWSLEKKLASMAAHSLAVAPPPPTAVEDRKHDAAKARSSGLRKWELLADLAQRASGAGHYLIACRSLLYAMERLAPLVDSASGFAYERQRAWWALGDTFRHLGRLDLHVEATSRSRAESSDCEKSEWRALAESQSTRFERDLAAQSTMQCLAHIREHYEAARHTQQTSDLQLEDVDDGEILYSKT